MFLRTLQDARANVQDSNLAARVLYLAANEKKGKS